MAVLGLLGFLLMIAGAIAAIVLIAKAVVRGLNGPQPVDPNAPPAPPKSNTVLVLLVVGGLIATAFIYFIGGALAVR